MAALARLPDYDWLVLTSRSAVEHTAAALAVAEVDRDALASVRVACVGPATAVNSSAAAAAAAPPPNESFVAILASNAP